MTLKTMEVFHILRDAAKKQIEEDEGTCYYSQVAQAQADALDRDGYVVVHKSQLPEVVIHEELDEPTTCTVIVNNLIRFDGVSRDALLSKVGQSANESSLYYDLLEAYMDHVAECEGTDFLTATWQKQSSISQENWDRLQEFEVDIRLKREEENDD